MRHVRDVIRLKSAGMPIREIARRPRTFLICILFTANAAIAEKRVAFVVGNENTAKWNRLCLQLPPGAACGHARTAPPAPLDLLRLHLPEIGLLHHLVVA